MAETGRRLNDRVSNASRQGAASIGGIDDGVGDGIIPCAAGPLIETPGGPRPVAHLRPGDLVTTLDEGPQPVRQIARRVIGLAELVADPGLQPVEILPGALGPGLPDRAVLVLPQHRILFGGAVCELHFGAEEVLVPATQLVGRRNVRQRMQAVTHVQIMFDRHQMVRAHGLWLESHQPGLHRVAGMPDLPRADVVRLVPDLAGAGCCKATRMTLKDYETRVLLAS